MTGKGKHPLAAWISLFVVAVAGMLLWREELYRHGWDGLDWIGYFHWAIPEGVALFLVWLAIFCGITPPIRRVGFVVTAAAFALGVYYAVDFAVFWYFGPPGPPLGFLLLMTEGETPIRLYHHVFYLVVPAIPLFACLGAKVFGVRVTRAKWILSVALFLAAGPISICLLAATRHEGGPDGIHTIKSGYIIPFLIVSLGIPFLPFPTRRRTEPAQVVEPSSPKG